MALIEGSETALNDAIRTINAARRAGKPCIEEDILEPIFEAESRLAVYGPRSPGRMENPLLARFAGQWGVGALRGRQAAALFGAPSLRWDPAGDAIAVSVLRAPAIAWGMLDAFATGAFVRILAPWELASGEIVVANLYEPK